MDLKHLTRSSKVSNLVITKPTIVNFIPDFNYSTHDLIRKSGIRMLNCKGLVTKSSTTKIGVKTFHAKPLFIKTKEKLTTNKNKGEKAIQVYQNIPKQIEKNSFLAIDHSIMSQATKYMNDIIESKRLVFFLFNQLKKETTFIKAKFPSYSNLPVFLLKVPNKNETSILNIINLLPLISENELNTNCNVFDSFIMVSLQTPKEAVLLPIMGYDKGKIKIFRNNITSINNLIDKFNNEKVMSSETDDIKDEKGVSLAKPIIKVKDNNIYSSFEINQKQLSRILKKYKIKDKTIANNIKSALDSFVTIAEDVKEEELEQIVLKAIHNSLFGTPHIKDEYLHSPAKLINKLAEVNIYSKPINIQELKEDSAVEPKEIIQLKNITGLIRQEYEFSENIHSNIKNLFMALSNRKDYPIKITKFKYDYQDDNYNRVINYQVTLQNTTGGDTKPYTVNLKVPALVNNRYFKLNGKNWIMSNQMFFNPITKTDLNKCRLLSSYAMLTLEIVNMKFDITQLSTIIEFIENKYPQLIKSIEREMISIKSVSFKNGAVINISEQPYYKDNEVELVVDDNDKVSIIKGDETIEYPQGKFEFIFDKLLDIIHIANPDETLNRTAKTIPYIQMYLSGIKTPLIIYMWQQQGLINALTKLGFDYEILDADKVKANSNKFFFKLKDNKILVISKESKRQELIVNGLLFIPPRFKFDEKSINNPETINEFITFKNGSRGVQYLTNNTKNLIDPITKQLLEFEDKPTDVINLISEEMIDTLLNHKPDALTDLSIYRSRQAEIMFNLAYDMLMMSHNMYKSKIDFGDTEAKIFLDEDYIIDCLLGIHPHLKGNSVLEYQDAYSPIAELKSASKLIKTGPSGIPSKRSHKSAHRNIHPSYYGNIGANATTEYADVGNIAPFIGNNNRSPRELLEVP